MFKELSEMSIEELKAHGYDLLATVQRAQNELSIVNNRIVELDKLKMEEKNEETN